MPGLAASRWAKGRSSRFGLSYSDIQPGSSTPNDVDQLRISAEELNRYTRIVRRLKWKLPYLADGYRQATAAAVADETGEAELMFKLDFFEYYMLVERALVHLLGVFGIVVSREFANSQLQQRLSESTSGRTAVEAATTTGAGAAAAARPSPFTHRYHANVLDALDNPANPLRGVLGAGSDVRRQLARAKDLRNRWKNADDGGETNGTNGGNSTSSATSAAAMAATTPPLQSYDLEHILSSIFAGFDAAFAVAERFVAEQTERESNARRAGADATRGGEQLDCDMGTEEQQWGFMVDAMDWESV